VLEETPKEFSLRLAAIFHDIGKPETFFKDDSGVGHFYNHEKKSLEITEKILRRMKYSNEIIKKTLKIIDEHMTVYNDEFSDKAVKRLIKRIEPMSIDEFVAFQIADIKATANPEKYNHVIALKKRVEAIKDRKEPLSIKDLAINGYDLMVLGVPEGKAVGNILNYLFERVLENPKLNEYKELTSLANDYLENRSNHD
jgi:tRNA nucleotidyltransferase (CCA-adding enzyme)